MMLIAAIRLYDGMNDWFDW